MDANMVEAAKLAGDVASGAVVLATLTAWLPPIAAGLTIIWTCIRIYEWMKRGNAD